MGRKEFQIRVECHAGYRGAETPRRFFLGERRIEIVRILDRWMGEDHRYFKVCDEGGVVYILRFDERLDIWEFIMFDRRQVE